MRPLTEIQQNALGYIVSRWEAGEALPSCREIAAQFGWASPKAASDIIEVLKRKCYLATDPGSTRKYRLTPSATGLPVLGDIAAGLPIDVLEAHDEHFNLSPASFGVNHRAAAFLLRVRGDSMTGRLIFDGDLVLVEKSQHAQNKTVVAALIDNRVTLKTLVREGGRTWLRSENPAYPDLIPLQDLQIQGIARGVLRPLKP